MHDGNKGVLDEMRDIIRLPILAPQQASVMVINKTNPPVTRNGLKDR